MGTTTSLILFYILGALIIISSILAVTTRRMLRAVVFLLFVLVGTAGLYLLLNYHFLAAVQLSVYVGGILALFIFAILLTAKSYKPEPHDRNRVVGGLLTAVVGIAVTSFVLMKHKFLYGDNPTILGDSEIDMKVIGHALVGSEKYQYLLPFEIMSILLLVCVIAGVIIARKR